MLSALVRLFLPDVPLEVADSMTTITLTPPSSPEWEMLDWDTLSVDQVSSRFNYTLNQPERSDLISILGLARLLGKPHCGVSEPVSQCREAILVPSELVQIHAPPANVVASTPKFSPNLEWHNLSWSADLVLSVSYSARKRQWTDMPTLPPGQYTIGIMVQTDGSTLWSVQLLGTDKTDLGIMNIRLQGPLPQYTCRVYTEAPSVLSFAVPINQSSDMNAIVNLANGRGQTMLGRDIPLWTTDHKQIVNARATKEDLTKEGIEPNPGPNTGNYLADKIASFCQVNASGLVAVGIFDLLSQNRFHLLSLVDPSADRADPQWDIPDDDDSKPQRPAPKKGSTRADITPTDQTQGSGPKSGQPPRPRADVDKARDRQAVIMRIAGNLNSNPKYAAKFVAVMASMRPRFIREVANTAWGLGWANEQVLTPVQWATHCYLNRVNEAEALSALMDAIWLAQNKSANNAEDIPNANDAILDITGSGYVEAKARTINRMMHSLNGNIFSATMQDVDSAPSLWGMVETPEPANTSVPMANRNIILTNIATDNYNLQHGQDSAGLVADTVEVNGASVPNMRALYPYSGIQLSASLQGHYDRENRGVLQFTPRRGGSVVVNVRLVSYYVNSLRPTTMAAEINNQIAAHGTYKTRATDSAQNGYSLADIVDLNAIQVAEGLSMERPLVAMIILHSAIRHSDINNVPPSCFITQSDMVRVGDERGLKFDWYNPDNITRVDGAATVFPFSGVAGKLRFHLTLQTVSAANRSKALFVPMSVLATGGDPNRALALFIMSICEWPFALGEYRAERTLEDPDTYIWHTRASPETFYSTSEGSWGGLATIRWQLNHMLTYIPGLLDMDVVLPRAYATNLPKSAGDARNQAEFIPTTGPSELSVEGDVVYPASQDIPINYVGIAQPASTNLCDYLNSWLPTMTTSTVETVISNLNCHFNIEADMMTSSDISIMLTQRAPPLLNTQHNPVESIGDAPQPNALSETPPLPDETEPATAESSDTDNEIPTTLSGSQPSKTSKPNRFSAAQRRIWDGSLSTSACQQDTHSSEGGAVSDQIHYTDIIHTQASMLYTPMLMSGRRVTCYTTTHNRIDVLDRYNSRLTVPYTDHDDRANYTMMHFNTLAWNKVAVGLATSGDGSAGNASPLLPFLADTMSIHGEIHRAIQLATPVQLMTADIGACSSYYQDPTVAGNYPDLRSVILSFGITLAQPRTLEPAPMAPLLDRLYASVYSGALPKVHTNVGGTLVPVSVYGRATYSAMPMMWIDDRHQTDKGTIPNNAPVMKPSTLYCPCILPDIWVYSLADKLPKRAMSFPLPYGLHGPAGYAAGLETRRFKTNEITPRCTPQLNKDYYPSDCLPENNDETQWNVRLWVSAVKEAINWRWCDSEVPSTWYSRDRLPAAIITAPGPWSTFGQNWFFNVSTIPMPIVDHTARRVYPAVDMQVAYNLPVAEVRNTRLQLPTWVIGNPQMGNPSIADASGLTSRFHKGFRLSASGAQKPPPTIEIPPLAVPQPPNQAAQIPASVPLQESAAGQPPPVAAAEV
ncbi:MAG: hypothetical protein 1 [Zeugodacus tau toti-like virus 2]|nr:MAG: hypothetical protein 1 [Zeugodacus tau toti-like virus 2]